MDLGSMLTPSELLRATSFVKTWSLTTWNLCLKKIRFGKRHFPVEPWSLRITQAPSFHENIKSGIVGLHLSYLPCSVIGRGQGYCMRHLFLSAYICIPYILWPDTLSLLPPARHFYGSLWMRMDDVHWCIWLVSVLQFISLRFVSREMAQSWLKM